MVIGAPAVPRLVSAAKLTAPAVIVSPPARLPLLLPDRTRVPLPNPLVRLLAVIGTLTVAVPRFWTVPRVSTVALATEITPSVPRSRPENPDTVRELAEVPTLVPANRTAPLWTERVPVPDRVRAVPPVPATSASRELIALPVWPVSDAVMRTLSVAPAAA